jgi:hypothetical protein
LVLIPTWFWFQSQLDFGCIKKQKWKQSVEKTEKSPR